MLLFIVFLFFLEIINFFGFIYPAEVLQIENLLLFFYLLVKLPELMFQNSIHPLNFDFFQFLNKFFVRFLFFRKKLLFIFPVVYILRVVHLFDDIFIFVEPPG